MPLELEKVGTSLGVGTLDVVAEYLDESQGYEKAFQNITDWSRTAIVVGGGLANWARMGPEDITESAVIAGIPLMEKSLVEAVKDYTGIMGSPSGRGRVGLKLVKKGAGTQSPSSVPTRWG